MSKQHKLLFLFVATFFSYFIFGYVSEFQLQPSSTGGSLGVASLIFFDLYFVEFLVTSAIVAICLNYEFKIRLIGYAFISGVLAVNASQLSSLRIGGEFVTPLALQNASHIHLVMSGEVITYYIIFSLALVSMLFLIETSSRNNNDRLGKRAIIGMLFVALLFQQSKYLVSENTNDLRDALLTQNSLHRTSPTMAMLDSLAKVIEGDNEKLNDIKDLTTADVRRLAKYGYKVDLNSDYPFLKEKFYKGSAPFATKSEVTSTPNVIIFFIEGTSARNLGVYSDRYPDLTPNLNKLAEHEHSMVVHNYMNHSAATYNGLLGTLCSMFPMSGKGYAEGKYVQASYRCLQNIFNDKGYESVFFDSHVAENAYVDELAEKLGFLKVINARELSKRFLNNAKPNYKRASLSDGQFYKAFTSYLKERAEKKDRKPLFTALYNLGTHAFIDVTPDGQRYKNGENKSLNRMHNADKAFGEFFEYYKSSPYLRDTVLIVTSDHCSYFEESHIDAFADESFQKIFIDKMPLIIFDPNRKLPKKIDVKTATSIDFAPSLMHYLGFSHEKNHFLGNSIFEEDRAGLRLHGFSGYNYNYYVNIEGVSYYKGHFGPYQREYDLAERFITYVRKIEKENKLWPQNSSKSEEGENKAKSPVHSTDN